MTSTELFSTHGTARIPDDEVISRAMQIFKTVAEVNRGLDSAGLPGNVEVIQAPGNRGAVVRIEIRKSEESSFEHQLSPYEGKTTSQRLESALRQLKGRLETGEVATTEGQPSGRHQ